MHPSLLPRHRGPSAFEWAFRSDDPETGFTIHRLAPDFDTGPILAQARIPIDDDDDVHTLLTKLGPVTPELLRQAIARVARGDPGEPQDESQATYAGLMEDAWRVIDWSRPARTVHNQVRSWTGMLGSRKGALGEVEGERVVVTKTRLLPTDAERGRGAPGTVVSREGGQFVMLCGDGPLAILEWGPAAAD
jgi:methionyl-tRNA formyltransferase